MARRIHTVLQPLDHNVYLETPPGFVEALIVTAVLVVLGIVAFVLWRRFESRKA